MKPFWVVKLTKTPVRNDFASDYFPRKFYYKKEAKDLVKEVQNKGGDAVISPSFLKAAK